MDCMKKSRTSPSPWTFTLHSFYGTARRNRLSSPKLARPLHASTNSCLYCRHVYESHTLIPLLGAKVPASQQFPPSVPIFFPPAGCSLLVPRGCLSPPFAAFPLLCSPKSHLFLPSRFLNHFPNGCSPSLRRRRRESRIISRGGSSQGLWRVIYEKRQRGMWDCGGLDGRNGKWECDVYSLCFFLSLSLSILSLYLSLSLFLSL